MMRWVVLSIVVVALTAIITVASFYLTPVTTDLVTQLRTTPDPARTGPPGKAIVVGGTTVFDFGTMPKKTQGEHDWTIKNEGEGDIVLEMGKTTCSCTHADPKEGEQITLKKGETKVIKVTFNTKDWDKFHQQAPVIVHNDPNIQEIVLTIDGEVKPAVLTYPPDTNIALATISNDTPIIRDIAVFSFDRPNLKILEKKLTDNDSITLQEHELTPDECKQLKVQKGKRLTVTVKPTPKLGHFSEEITLKLDHPQQETLKLVVSGTRVGPISVFPDRVRLFDVNAKQGASQTLTVLVRGKEDTKFTVDHLPDSMKVDVAPMGKFGEGKVQKYQLTVKVQPDAKPGEISDNIILKTDHPGASELKIPVSVVVAGRAG